VSDPGFIGDLRHFEGLSTARNMMRGKDALLEQSWLGPGTSYLQPVETDRDQPANAAADFGP
jgi:hypothetical protein